jgi:type IV pilus assembly protein PilV
MALTPGERAQAGFTLVESLVALTVLLIGLLALAMLQNVAYRANTLARNTTAATILASERIERLNRLGAANVSTGTGSATVDGMSFSESWKTTAAPSVDNGARSVDMQVQWSDQWGSHKVTFPTVVR